MTDMFELSSRTVDQLIELVPEEGTYLGIKAADNRWSDLSPQGHDQRNDFWIRVRTEAAACPVTSPADKVAQAVLLADASLQISLHEAGLHLADLNNIASPWQHVRDIFDIMSDETMADWADIVARLRTIDEPLDGYRECLEIGLSQKTTVAKRQVRVAIEQGRTASGEASGFQLLLDRFDASPVSTNPGATVRRAELGAAIDHAKAQFAKMTDWFEQHYLLGAQDEDGVGIERYVRAAEQFLGESIDPEALYTWGWQEIARLQDRYAELAGQIDPDRSIAEVMELLMTDPERGASSMEEFLRIMQQRQEQALANLDGSHFDVPEQIRTIEVKQAPPGGALAPYYSQPSEDFSRPGRVWYPTTDRTLIPLFDEISTAYHEGFPGHHLQVGWQSALGDTISRFHRLLTWYPGSGEGWALYAEHLMGELGYFEKPDYEIGLVTSQMFRSCRVVIDIGLHCGFDIPDDQDFHPGEPWTFDLAVEMLRDVAYTDPEMAESEVVRYCGWPGQAISYKVGEKAILDLRDEMSQRDDFDLKAFHATVLTAGSTGLDLLRDLVRSA